MPTTSSESLGTVVHKTSVAMGRKHDAEKGSKCSRLHSIWRGVGFGDGCDCESNCFGRCNIVILKVDAASSPKV